MASFWSRVLGLAPEPKADPKAAIGPGVIAMQWDVPLRDALNGGPQNLQAEAQALYHANVWVAAAERAIVGRLLRVPWRLEDADGNTIDKTSPPVAQAVKQQIERPSNQPGANTRRLLWGLTFRHEGLGGNAMWYLDQTERLAGTPLQILYINPKRMTEVLDGDGMLQGWILDHPQNSQRARGEPTPLEAANVLHFQLDPPDSGVWAIGIAEAAAAQIELNRLAVQQSSKVLAAGGRLAGLAMPKEQSNIQLTPDQWNQAIRDWRNITTDPDSARRLQVLAAPVDFVKTAADPVQLQLADVRVGSRDEVLAAWGVPGSQLGVPEPRGLNSGQTKAYDEAIIWQGPIQARWEAFRETFQYLYLDRFAQFGVELTIQMDFPTFDDLTPLYELAAKAAFVPMTGNERRGLVGFDPFDEDDPDLVEIGRQVYQSNTMNLITAGTTQDQTPIPTEQEPSSALVGPDDNVPGATPDEGDLLLGKASLETIRSKTLANMVPTARHLVARLLGEIKADVAARIAASGEHVKRRPRDTAVWWDAKRWRKQLGDLFETEYAALASDVVTRVGTQVAKPKAGPTPVLEYVRNKSGNRITGILDTTRDAIRDAIVTALEQGEDLDTVIGAVQASSAFDEARAETIARTEMAYAYNDATLGTYREYDIQMVEVTDGDGDEECADADGQTWTIDEAEADPLAHPNCTRDFIPITDAEPKARGDSLMSILRASIERPINLNVQPAGVTVNVPEQPAPVVNVPPAQNVINVPKQDPPVVNLPAPEKASGPSQVEVVSMPVRSHKLVRGKDGKPAGSVETDA